MSKVLQSTKGTKTCDVRRRDGITGDIKIKVSAKRPDKGVDVNSIESVEHP